MRQNNEKLLAIAHAALSMVDDSEWSEMFQNWLVQASGTVEAMAMLTRPTDKPKKRTAGKPKKRAPGAT